jgi:hypothetical protein
MTQRDPEIALILNQALPFEFDAPDWELILTESRNPPARRLPGRNRRKLVLLVALVLLAVLIPLSALGVANDWWFISVGGNPFGSNGKVTTVTSGRSEGGAWALVAFMTNEGGLCFSITPLPPTGSPGSDSTAAEAESSSGGIAGCSGIRAHEGGTWQPMVSFATGYTTTSSGKTTTIVGGPTDSSVAEVDVVEFNGKIVTTRTIPAPSELGVRARFFVVVLPPSTDLDVSMKEVIARDAAGKVLKRIFVAP